MPLPDSNQIESGKSFILAYQSVMFQHRPRRKKRPSSPSTQGKPCKKRGFLSRPAVRQAGIALHKPRLLLRQRKNTVSCVNSFKKKR